MPAPLSGDIRKRIINAKKRGDTHNKISKDLQISVSAITRILALYRETESYEPRPLNNGRKSCLSEEQMQQVMKKIEEQPDVTLQELIDEFALHITPGGLSKKLKKLNLTYKKSGVRSRTKPAGCSAEKKRMENQSKKPAGKPVGFSG